jgi:hypothetical protein
MRHAVQVIAKCFCAGKMPGFGLTVVAALDVPIQLKVAAVKSR